MTLTRREAVLRASRGLGALAASTAFLPEIARAASGAAPPSELGASDLDTLTAVTAAVAVANSLDAGVSARRTWREAFASSYRALDTPTRASVAATCARLRTDAPAGSMAAGAKPAETRAALQAALASRTSAERALETKLVAQGANAPADLATWLKGAQERIASRYEKLRDELGDDPAAIDPETGLLKYRDHFGSPPPAPDLSGTNDVAEPAVVRRLVAAAGVSMAAAVLYATPTQPEV